MPNWVFNTVTIRGNNKTITEMKEKLNTSYETLYDDIFNEGQQKIVQHNEPIFAFWNIVKPDDMQAYAKQPNNTHLDWYNWNCEHWGTKWDASEPRIEEEVTNKIVYYFETAWAPPDPAIRLLSEQHPNSKITLEYEEEGGWGGKINYEKGWIVSQYQYQYRCHCGKKWQLIPTLDDYDNCPACQSE